MYVSGHAGVPQSEVLPHRRPTGFRVPTSLAAGRRVAVATPIRLVSDLSHQVMSHVRPDVCLETTELAPVENTLSSTTARLIG